MGYGARVRVFSGELEIRGTPLRNVTDRVNMPRWNESMLYGGRMNSKTIREAVDNIEKHIPFSLPAMCWRFAAAVPNGATTVDDEKWMCMFSLVTGITDGEKVCFYQKHTGCGGAGCYLGFKEPSEDGPAFLAEKEKLKKDVQLGLAFYESIEARPPKEDYLVWQRVQDLEDGLEVETVNLWVTGHSLSGLVTLANYDRSGNENVIIPSRRVV